MFRLRFQIKEAVWSMGDDYCSIYIYIYILAEIRICLLITNPFCACHLDILCDNTICIFRAASPGRLEEHRPISRTATRWWPSSSGYSMRCGSGTSRNEVLKEVPLLPWVSSHTSSPSPRPAINTIWSQLWCWGVCSGVIRLSLCIIGMVFWYWSDFLLPFGCERIAGSDFYTFIHTHQEITSPITRRERRWPCLFMSCQYESRFHAASHGLSAAVNLKRKFSLKLWEKVIPCIECILSSWALIHTITGSLCFCQGHTLCRTGCSTRAVAWLLHPLIRCPVRLTMRTRCGPGSSSSRARRWTRHWNAPATNERRSDNIILFYTNVIS